MGIVLCVSVLSDHILKDLIFLQQIEPLMGVVLSSMDVMQCPSMCLLNIRTQNMNTSTARYKIGFKSKEMLILVKKRTKELYPADSKTEVGQM